jgi:aminomethyltransferase
VWRISRSGYTGEDGFEISLPGGEAANFARRLLEQPDVAPIGLGARDSLRLEAGLCLYGHDIDETTTPVEAGLRWTIGKRRRDEANFPGAPVILAQIAHGPKRRRIGIRPDGPAPAREGTVIEDESGKTVGQITSGGFGPTVGGPVAMGYVDSSMAEEGCPLGLVVRGKRREAHVIKLPFVPHKYIK